MAEDQEPSGPSLEPPSFFRRKKKKEEPSSAAAPPEPVAADESPTTILDDLGGDADQTQPLTPPVPATPDAPPPLFADEAPEPPAAAPVSSSDPDWSSRAPKTSQSASLDEPPPAATPAPVRRERTGPPLPGRVAAALAGLVAGLVIVGLTTGSFELCSRAQGTNSCGGAGIFLLVAILVVAVVAGAAILRLCLVPEPGSTSFLAVGLTSVVALLFLVDLLFEWWMLIVIPVVSVATFLLSHWVTTTFVEPAKQVGVADEPEAVDHDVR